MKPAILCICAALLASCAASVAEQAPMSEAAPSPPPPPAPPAPNAGLASQAGGDCPLTMVFGSYAMGIDGPTRARVEALLASDRAVTGFTARPWGREGEITLCARTRTPADAARLFAAIRALVPPRPRGPISVRTEAGLSYETPPPR